MADISKITLPNNNEYDLKDATARSGLTNKQDKITAEGILVGDGTGGITGIDSSAAGTISIDNTPTSNSSNLVTSGGVYSAIAGVPLDDHKWAGVELGASGANVAVDSFVPSKDSMGNTSGTASWARVTSTPQNYCIAKYDGNKYLYSTTPSASDNTTKVATTAFVQTALSNVDALPNQTGHSGDFLTTNGTTASWADLPEEIFLAEFNVSTFDEIKEAYDANKYIYLKYPTLKKTGTSEDIQWSICPLTQFYYEELDGTDYKGYAYFLMPLNTEPTPDPYLSYKYVWKEIDTSNNRELWATSTSSFSFAKSTHSHGNITNSGDITATAPTIANGDQIIINDDSASKITNGPTFDGSTTNKYLSPKGTWENTPSIASTSSVLKGDGSGNAVAATAGVDYQSPITTEEVTEITVDTTVTASSNNLITSGAVATAISNIDALPSQTGNNGKFLTTNGTAASWAAVPDASSMLNRSTAVNVADTNYSTVMARGIYAGDSDLSEGVSLLDSGVIYLYYE